MKTRTFFVSNSSSSSFIVLGYSFNSDFIEELEDGADLYDILADLDGDFTILNGSDDGISEGDVVFGVELFEFDDCGDCSTSTYSLQDITDKIIELKLELKKHLDIDIEDLKDPTIFGGVRCC